VDTQQSRCRVLRLPELLDRPGAAMCAVQSSAPAARPGVQDVRRARRPPWL
jgi:hypothetical protein